MAAEGQLGVGAALSMAEVMQRLVDQAKFDLQVGRKQQLQHQWQLHGHNRQAGGEGQ